MKQFIYISLILISLTVPNFQFIGSQDIVSPGYYEWHVEEIDAGSNYVDVICLALNNNDEPFVTYCDNVEGIGYIHYGSQQNNVWESELISSYSNSPSIAVDNNGRKYISYHNYSSSDLMLASYYDNQWHHQSLDDNGGLDSEIICDSEGEIHISYSSKYWHNTSKGIDVGCYYPSIALDSKNNPHISYHYQNSKIKYATFNNDQLYREIVCSSGSGYSSIALDSNDMPHIVYSSGYSINYAYYNGTWNNEYICQGKYPSFCLDSNDVPRLSFIEMNDEFPQYSYFNGEEWIFETISNVKSRFISLKIDSQGFPCVAFQDIEGNSIKYAKGGKETVKPKADAGPDLQTGNSGHCYFDASQSTDNFKIKDYNWSFFFNGYMNYMNGVNPTFHFTEIGEYEVTLKVTDFWNNWDADTLIVTVVDSIRPTAVIEDIKEIVNQYELMTLDGRGSSDDIGVVNFTWVISFQDKVDYRYGSICTYNFSVAGIGQITFMVYDAQGNWNYVNKHITVIDNTKPYADAGKNISVSQGAIITLNGLKSSDNVGIEKYTWLFSNNRSIISSNSTSTFSIKSPGIYFVTLNVTDSHGNWDSDEIKIIVLDSTNPIADPGEDIIEYQGKKIIIDGSDSTDNVGIVNYTWNFYYDHEHLYYYGEQMSFIFNIPMKYQINLTVWDEMNNSDISVVEVIIIPFYDDSQNITDDTHRENTDDDISKERIVIKEKSNIWLIVSIFLLIAIILILIVFIRYKNRSK